MSTVRVVVGAFLVSGIGFGQASVGGKWTKTEKIDKFNDQKSVVFQIRSNEHSGKDNLAGFSIVCKTGKTPEVFFMSARPYNSEEFVMAEVRHDKESARKAEWKTGSDRQIARIDAATAGTVLSGHGTLAVRVLTIDGLFAEPTFDLNGLSQAELQKSCANSPQ